MSDLESLILMGFDTESSRNALQIAGSLENAIQLLISGELETIDFTQGVEMKMVLVVRNDISMTAGKVAAQCVHAALGATRIAKTSRPSALSIWEASGEKVVCVQCKSLSELEGVHASAMTAGLPAYIVRDAGRTQVDAGASTVCGIGPAAAEDINLITGHLKLY